MRQITVSGFLQVRRSSAQQGYLGTVGMVVKFTKSMDGDPVSLSGPIKPVKTSALPELQVINHYKYDNAARK